MNAPHNLDEWTALYREARRAPPELAERILGEASRDPSDVSEHLDDPLDDHLDDPLDERHRPGSQPGGRWGVGLMAGALIGVAALLALTWSMDALRAAPASSSSAVEAPMQADPQENGGAAAVRTRELKTQASTPRPAPADAPTAGQATPSPVAPSPTPQTRAKTAPSTRPETDARSGSVDLESLRRLRAAEALLQRDAAAARQALERHARDYPQSPMMLEREALWIRAACSSGSGKDLERRRNAFFQRADVSAYRDAIRRACEE